MIMQKAEHEESTNGGEEQVVGLQAAPANTTLSEVSNCPAPEEAAGNFWIFYEPSRSSVKAFTRLQCETRHSDVAQATRDRC